MRLFLGCCGCLLNEGCDGGWEDCDGEETKQERMLIKDGAA